MRPDTSLALAALLCLAPLPALAAHVFAPKALEADEYAETFTFVADLDDGSYAQVQLSVTNLGPGSGHGICRALHVPASGQAWSGGERVGAKDWGHTAAGGGELLRVGPCSIRSAGNRTTVSARLDGRQIQLVFPAPAPERPPSHELPVGGGSHVTELVSVGAPVRLQIRGGGAPIALEGSGYADHSVSTVEPRVLARRWVRFRALRGERKLVLLGREALEGGFRPLWLRRAAGRYDTFARFAVARNGEAKAPRFVATVEGEQGALRIESDRVLHRHAPVEEFGVLSSVVKAFAGSPVTYTCRATLHGPGGETVPGILEISLAEE